MVMVIFPERGQKLWNAWELRAMVLLSLSLQIILILLGKWRKYTAKNWVRIILWLAYLSADWVATVSLGILAYSQGDHSLDPNDILIAFWAPFLILHLGGPDTITAYSLEDNELWLRHLLGLLVQVGVAFYVCLRSWTGNRLSDLTVLMFVPGIIKYGERTWVLRSASREHLRVSMLTLPHPGPNHAESEMVFETFSKLYDHTVCKNDILQDASIVPVAYYYFQTFKRLFADLIININDLKKSQRFFRENSWEEVFKVVEIELGFMYDILYTKATIGYTTIDCVLRSISLSSTIFLFVVFLTIEKHGYSNIDVMITHVLLVGAIVLEIYAVIVLVSSDWAILWLNKHKNSILNFIFRLISSFRFTSNKRWSNSMAQYNLLSFCLKDKSTTFYGIEKFYRINKKVEKYWYTTLEDVSIDLKSLIFQRLKMKSKSVTSLEDCKLFGGAEKYKFTLQHEFGHSIILWHITTDLCYYSGPDEIRTSPKCEMSKLVSDYMVYLLLMHPFMLPYGFMVPANFKLPKKVSLPNGVAQIIYQDTCVEAVQFFKKHKPISDKKEAFKMLLDNTPPYKKGGTDNSVLFDCCRLAKKVLEDERLLKWEMISDVWVEMLIFAASKCTGNYHAQQLRQGGELLTHVWLLMAHLVPITASNHARDAYLPSAKVENHVLHILVLNLEKDKGKQIDVILILLFSIASHSIYSFRTQTSALSLLVCFLCENKRRVVMEIFPERVQKLWNDWELRMMVLLSLYLQIILIFFGKWRKYNSKNWVRIILWLAYLSADWVATVSLGILSNSQGDSSNKNSGDDSRDPNDVLIAFWAPFLLLHLGGPDTITAYSLEDNELWLRHLLGLLVQVGVAFYVFLRSWTGNRLSFFAIPLFIPGIIKYGERTWVLRSASSEHFQDSMLTKFMAEYRDHTGGGRLVIDMTPDHSDIIGSAIIPDARNLSYAYNFSKSFKRLFADLVITSHNLMKSQAFFKANSWEDAFKVVEMELGFMYDELYSKASIVYTRVGCILRSISLSSTITLFVVFLIIDKHGYSNINIMVTHILLVGAIVLEIYAVIVLLSSDWAILWLSKHKKSFLNIIFRLISSFPLTSNKRWSNSMAQFSVISFCLKDKSRHGIQKLYHINDKLEKYLYTTSVEVSSDLKKLIFQQLKEFSTSVTSSEDFQELRFIGVGKLFSTIGRDAKYKWTFQVEFGHSILLWHIATDIYYNSDPNEIRTSPKCQMSKLVSDYMLYLLVMCPSMLANGVMLPGLELPKNVALPNAIGEIMFQDTCDEAEQYLKEQESISDRRQACMALLKVNPNSPPHDVVGDRGNSVLWDGCRLAKLLETEERLAKWEMMSNVWVEMLYFAAGKCRGIYHAQQLRRGGELLTHVWLLMAHFGITEQVQISRG
ncbi:hypothetical protein HHK36_014388 [Tetracentron sinense]|uniref:DUF4220 domain-containing protein n=1 Tax=Tetracentron sinense TaxID=13715 RepID=A0A834Z815_TETSI|nr:hypothetical protein HHK36_014388 [Tetracentron sinense]